MCVSLSCHLWPDVVVSSQRIAIENEKVEAEMRDISNFKEIKDKFKLYFCKDKLLIEPLLLSL